MTDPDKEASERVPTMVSSRFYITAGDTHTRIAFGHVVGSTTAFHTAVQLTNGDADALAELIERLHARRATPPATAE